MDESYDIIVVGTGIAGLATALYIAENRSETRIALLSKNDGRESCSYRAQGGIAFPALSLTDSENLHISDTLVTGHHKAISKVVREVIHASQARLYDLQRWGVLFDRADNGHYHLAREGSHSLPRILHVGDRTGFEVMEILWERVSQFSNIHHYPFHLALDLMKLRQGRNKDRCVGVVAFASKRQVEVRFSSRLSILATGGVGSLFANSTNPSGTTGDGIAMAMRAGAQLKDGQYLQFHPTALFESKSSTRFLLSEALRGAGAILLNSNGERFMHNYSPLGELAGRDVVCRAISSEMTTTNSDCAYLDLRPIPTEELYVRFPAITRELEQNGYKLGKQPIPVVPAAHFLCGGIQVDLKGKTGVLGMLAAGECAYTGLHGSNRLASNSLLEALEFARRCARSALEELSTNSPKPLQGNLPTFEYAQPSLSKEQIEHLFDELRNMNSMALGVIRSNKQLVKAKIQLNTWQELLKTHNDSLHPDFQELINAIQISQWMIASSLECNQNSGTFYKTNNLV